MQLVDAAEVLVHQPRTLVAGRNRLGITKPKMLRCSHWRGWEVVVGGLEGLSNTTVLLRVFQSNTIIPQSVNKAANRITPV